VEFSTESQWENKQISARAIIDGTASDAEPWPVWLFHGRNKALILDRESVSPHSQAGMAAFPLSDMGQAGFTRFDTNLRPTQAK
jgi:hypothetical protein